MRKTNLSGEFKRITTGTKAKDLVVNQNFDDKSLIDFGEELLEDDVQNFSLPNTFQHYQKHEVLFNYFFALHYK